LTLARVLRELPGNEAATRPDHPHPGLRGRRYAIPFEQVWTAAVALVATAARWQLIDADDQAGVILAEARTRILKFIDDVEIRISLDADAQTRVDMASRSRVGKADLGTNARRIRHFLHRLDRRLNASPGLRLPPESGADTVLSA